jgi:hypothetical protein
VTEQRTAVGCVPESVVAYGTETVGSVVPCGLGSCGYHRQRSKRHKAFEEFFDHDLLIVLVDGAKVVKKA